jgi:peptidoglycan/LPS O-acetylase OafA/YrhL
LGAIVSVILAVTAYRTQQVLGGHILSNDDWDNLLRKQVVTRLDSLMFGVLGAWLMRFHPAQFFRSPRLMFGCGLVLLAVDRAANSFPVYENFITLSLMPLAVLLMLPFLQRLQVPPSPIRMAITFISVISYSLYLLHASFARDSVVRVVAQLFPKEQVPLAGLYMSYWVVSLLAAYTMYRVVELPFLRLRDRRMPEAGSVPLLKRTS